MSGRTAGSNGQRAAARRPAPSARSGGRRVSPGLVFLLVAVIGSVIYMAYVITVRDNSQIPLMASGAVVLSIVFIALAAYSFRALLRAGVEGRSGRAVLIALVGGGAAMAAALGIAGAIILFQIAAGPAAVPS
jgi:hypothetical protein